MDETAENQRFFRERLLEWYHTNKRDLPWRRTKDPYRIWVSEVMLQQTRVDAVIPYYYQFLERFPTLQALAEAPEEDVLKAWEGLGYYSRARNLQKAAREVVESCGGIVPADKEKMSALKGVGPYTAGAVLSIAYNLAEPAVDGNVMRVLSRFFQIEDDIAKPATRKKLEALARELIPPGAAGDFNQAVMELGALICTPKSPGCLVCPLMEQCAGRLNGKVEQLPVKTKTKPPRIERRIAALVAGEGEHAGKIYVRRRPDAGLLAQMWELPHFMLNEAAAEQVAGRNEAALAELARRLRREAGISALPSYKLMQVEHTFSHIRWILDVYVFRNTKTADRDWVIGEKPDKPSEILLAEDAGQYGSQAAWTMQGRWIEPHEWDKLAFPKAFQRIFAEYMKTGISNREEYL